MLLSIAPNKIYKVNQNLDLTSHRIITLVGENGSGKSAILEKVFRDLVNNNNIILISFTSGQNECFTSIFYKHLKETRRFLIEHRSFDSGEASNQDRLSINSFHFDQNWVRWLIFFATTVKQTGKTREYLINKGIIRVSDDGLNDDIVTTIEFRMRVLTNYLDKLNFDDARESDDYTFRSIRRTTFHRILERLVIAYEPAYDFVKPLYTRKRKLLSRDAFNILGKDVQEIFTFLGQALYGDIFIEKDTVKLYFADGLELNDLSDGEFQLLSIYALTDLFDGSNTLFLFDEIDSHIHYINTQKLWTFLKGISGKLITSTHSADSIILHDPTSIRLVNKGKIEEELTAEHLFKRLSSLTDNHTYQFKVAAKFEFIALVENKFDWKLFLLLAKRKVPHYNEIIETVRFIKCSSGYNNAGQNFADTRKKWVEDFKKVNRNSCDTIAIFFICDRDSLPLNNISRDGITLNGIGDIPAFKNSVKPFALAWKRKEIENYLVCHSLLNAHNKVEEFQQEKGVVILNNNTLDNDVIRNLEVKAFFQQFYLKEGLDVMDSVEEGVDYEKLDRLVNLIPPEEISEDILNMYNFVLQKITI